MKLRYERGAVADLDEIFSYIAKDNPQAASRVVARVEEVAARIAAFPHIGRATRNPRFRRFPIGKYLIVYEVGKDEVVIHYVRHGARQRPWEGEE
jgi:toxin ParE1/3/4